MGRKWYIKGNVKGKCIAFSSHSNTTIEYFSTLRNTAKNVYITRAFFTPTLLLYSSWASHRGVRPSLVFFVRQRRVSMRCFHLCSPNGNFLNDVFPYKNRYIWKTISKWTRAPKTLGVKNIPRIRPILQWMILLLLNIIHCLWWELH